MIKKKIIFAMYHTDLLSNQTLKCSLFIAYVHLTLRFFFFEMFSIKWTYNFEKIPILRTSILRCFLFNVLVNVFTCSLFNVHKHVILRCSLHNHSIHTLGEGTTPLATEVVTSADCLYRSSWGVDRGVCKLRPSVLINYKKKN